MRGAIMAASGALPAALTIFAGPAINRSSRPEFQPNIDSAAYPGDILICLGDVPPFPTSGAGSVWQGDGRVRWQVLTAATMSVNLYRPSLSQWFQVVVLRNVASIVRRVLASAYLNTIIPGYAKSANHVGMLMYTAIDPASIEAVPPVYVGSTYIDSLVRYYGGGSVDTLNLHSYFNPARPTYPDNTTFKVGAKASWQTDFAAYECIGG